MVPSRVAINVATGFLPNQFKTSKTKTIVGVGVSKKKRKKGLGTHGDGNGNDEKWKRENRGASPFPSLIKSRL